MKKDKKINFKLYIWGVAVAFLLHNSEEFLSQYSWFMRHFLSIPEFFINMLPPELKLSEINSLMKIALGLATLLPALISFWAFLRPRKSVAFILLVLLYWVAALNAVQHIAISLFFLEYSPGVITATLINLPLSVLFFRRIVAENRITKGLVIKLLPLSIVFYAVGLYLIWLASYFIVKIL